MSRSPPPLAAATSRSRSSYQGCAEAGLCYPPTHKTVQVQLAAPGASPAPRDPGVADTGPMRSDAGCARRQDTQRQPARGARDILRRGPAAGVHALRAADGPDPVGHHRRAGRDRPTRGRAFSLSLAYVLGMALTYTVAGAAFAGRGPATHRRSSSSRGSSSLFAVLFVVLALAMFGPIQPADAGRVPGRAHGPEQPPAAGHAASASPSWARCRR